MESQPPLARGREDESDEDRDGVRRMPQSYSSSIFFHSTNPHVLRCFSSGTIDWIFNLSRRGFRQIDETEYSFVLSEGVTNDIP
jgi:hypothetical protein